MTRRRSDDQMLALESRLNDRLTEMLESLSRFDARVLQLMDLHAPNMTRDRPSDPSSNLHPGNIGDVRFFCGECGMPWPCREFRNLDGLYRTVHGFNADGRDWAPLVLSRLPSAESASSA